MKVFDVCGIIAVDGDIKNVFSGEENHSLFFGNDLEEVIDLAIAHGYSRKNCRQIFIEVKKDDATKEIERESGNQRANATLCEGD